MDYKFSKNLKIKKYYKEPTQIYNIVSVSVFRLYDNYKPMDTYYDRFNLFIDNFEKYMKNYYLRVYIDNSLIKKCGIPVIDKEIEDIWKPLIKKLLKLKFVQLIKYKHLDFIDDTYSQCHRGTFGTIMRFVPMFNYNDNKNIQTIIIMDIDMTIKSFQTYNNLVKYMFDHKLNFMFRTSFCKYTKSRHNIVSEMIDSWLRVMAGTIVLYDYKFSKSILNNFFGYIKFNDIYNDEYWSKYINIFKNYDKDDNGNVYKKKVNDNIFKYGIDELLSLFMLHNILNNKIPFGYLSTKDIDVPFFIHATKHEYYIDDNDILSKKLLKKIGGKYYKDNISLHLNYKYIDNKLTNVIFNKNNDEISNQIMKNYINMFIEFKNNNYNNEYGFTIEEIKCVNRQLNINSQYPYYIHKYD